MAWKCGAELTSQDQLAAVNKWLAPNQLGCEHLSVAEWLAANRFRVNGHGRLDRKARFCYPIGSNSMFEERANERY
jgi:hypothetical protein